MRIRQRASNRLVGTCPSQAKRQNVHMSVRPIRLIFLLQFCVILRADVVPVTVVTNAVIRVMAANLNGNVQSYQDFALRIFAGLKPDVVAINEFNFGGNAPTDFRRMLDTAFGTNFTYFRESGYNIPNGIISRWPILASGSWDDAEIPDRGFAWARLDIPGPNDLYVVSVHLKSSSGSADRRVNEANQLKQLVAANFPADAFVVIAGDLNLENRNEGALGILRTFLRDEPIPTDQSGDADTNNGRAKPYDFVLNSASLRANFVPVKIGSQAFANGLVFDSRVYSPLTDVVPVQPADSGQAQHMAVLKDYRLSFTTTNFVAVTAPALTFDGQGILRWTAPANLTWTVLAANAPADLQPLGKATSASSSYAFTNGNKLNGTMFYRVTYP